LEGLLEGGSIAGHGEAGFSHEVDVVGMTVEAPGELLDGEELGVVVF